MEPVIRDVDLLLEVVGTSRPAPGYLNVAFARPAHFDYLPGDWIEFAFDPHRRGGPVYSLSSSPTESDLVITFREGVSEIKRLLTAVQPGDRLRVVEFGNDYGFTLKQHRSSVLIAGGVGVAPFRSMLKEVADTGSGNNVQLIYMNQTDDFLFRDEFDEWARQDSSISVIYITTADVKRKDRERMVNESITPGAADFYVSGPPGMVDSTVRLLTVNGVPSQRVKVDRFDGY